MVYNEIREKIMTIPIYKAEIADGLEGQIQASASFSVLADVTVCDPSELEKGKLIKLLNTQAKANPEQFDLFYMQSVLASVGWNKNDDVFGHYNTWKARNTPVDKPFNFMHDPKDVIGHITSSIVVDPEGSVIPDDTPMDDIPDQFDVVVGSVLYRHPPDEDMKARAAKIIEEIVEGKWKVSMECWFGGFDYAVITPAGASHVIARTEESAFLTKYLKKYGGSGEYDGHRIGRFLKDFTFSGKGLVEQPANPRSDILGHSDDEETTVFVSATEAQLETLNIKEDTDMADNTVQKELYDDLKKDLDEVKASIVTKDATIAELETKVAELTAAQETMQSEAQVTKASTDEKDKQIETLTADLDKTKKELDETQAKLGEIEKEAEKAIRLGKVKERDVTDEKAAELVEKFAEASDEMFDAMVSALPEKAQAEEEEEKEGDEEATAEEKAAAEEAEKKLAEAKAKEEAEVANASEGEEPELCAAAASWVGDVLNSTQEKSE
jgi:hypothetical protein